MRSTVPRAVRAEGSIGRSSEGKSERPLQRQSPRRQVARKALFVLPSFQSKSHSYRGTPLSPRLLKANRLQGRSAYSRFPSAEKRAERHEDRKSTRLNSSHTVM